MIDEVTKQKILDAADIVDVVSEFVALRKSGVNYVGLCPFHADRNPSFSVSPSRNICKCFSCGEGGTPASFLMKLEGMSFPEALRFLAKKYNIEIEEKELSEEERNRRNEQESIYLIQKFASEFFQKELLESEEGKAVALTYLQHRGISEEMIHKFGIGYSPSVYDALLSKAKQEGYNPSFLYKSGLCFEPSENKSGGDRFRERIIFPILSISGRVVAFGGRIMGNKEKIAKYINSPENVVYTKSRELFGIYLAKKAISKEDRAYLVEGYLDVVAMHQAGIENVVAPCGTALTEQQIRLIRRFSKNITLLFDGDGAGLKAAIRSIDLLLESGMHVRVITLPEGEDPDSFVRSHSQAEIKEYLQQKEMDFLTFKTELFRPDMRDNPIRKAEVINDLVHSVAMIPDVIERSIYAQSIARSLSLDEKMLLQQVKLERARHYTNQTNSYRKEEQEAIKEESNNSPSIRKELHPTEEDLIRILIRYGETKLPITEEDGSVGEMSIAKFITESIDISEIQEISVFSEIINETEKELENSEDFKPSSYFSNHSSAIIEKTALDMLLDPHKLSSSSRKTLDLDEENEQKRVDQIAKDLVRSITAYKAHIVNEKLKQCHKQLQQAQRERNDEKVLSLMQEFSDLTRLKTEYAQELGNRTIIQ